MKRLTPPLLLLLLLAPLTRGVITNNVPISEMVITTNVLDNAYFPLIQPYPGRTTNDNFRATTLSIFNGRSTASFTNITVNNLTVVSNLFLTNVTVQEFSTTNIFNNTTTFITNSFLVISNTTVTINGTNVATINPTVGRVPYNVDGTNFGDSALFYIDPNTVGAAEVDAGLVAITNLANNTFLVTRTIGGIDGVITNGPAITDLELWTNSLGYLEPSDTTATNKFRIKDLGPGSGVELSESPDTLITFNQGAAGYTFFQNLTGAGTPIVTIGNGLVTLQRGAISTGNPILTYGFQAQNSSVATSGGQQNSPAMTWAGQGWGTNSATSQTVLFGSYVVPSAGADTPSGLWKMDAAVSNAPSATVFSISTASGYAGTGGKVFHDNGMFSSTILADPTQITTPVGGDVAPVLVNVVSTNLAAASTFNDLYTVPAGNIAWVGNGTLYVPPGTASCLVSVFAKSGGVYYHLGSTNSTVTTNTPTAISSFTGRFIDAGDSISVTNSQAGLSCYAVIKLYTNTTGIKIPHIYGLTNSPTLLYTVPGGKTAVGIGAIGPGFLSFGAINFACDPVASPSFNVWIVPSGAAVDNSTLVAAKAASIGGCNIGNLPPLSAGTKVYVSTSTAAAGQSASFEVYEY